MDSIWWHRRLLLDIHFIVYTNNNTIIYLLRKTEASTRVMWWIITLSEYNAEYYHLPECQNVVADTLLRNPLEGQKDASREPKYNCKYATLCESYNIA